MQISSDTTVTHTETYRVRIDFGDEPLLFQYQYGYRRDSTMRNGQAMTVIFGTTVPFGEDPTARRVESRDYSVKARTVSKDGKLGAVKQVGRFGSVFPDPGSEPDVKIRALIAEALAEQFAAVHP